MATEVEEKPFEIDIAKLKRRKYVLSGTTAVMIVGLLFVMHERLAIHLDAHLITTAEAQTMSGQIKDASEAAKQAAQAAENVGTRLESYIKNQDVKAARERLNEVKQQLGETQLWEASNGANDISRARKADLIAQIEVLTAFISCMETGRAICAQ